MAAETRAPRREKTAALSKGLPAPETAEVSDDLEELPAAVEDDTGAVSGRYRDPVGPTPVLLVSLPIDRVEPTPNGNHGLQALKKLGPGSAIARLVPSPDVAFTILALNTEKAHNLREKSLETIRMARALANKSDGNESRPRLSGGAYRSIVRKTDDVLDHVDEASDKIVAGAEKFNIDRVKQEDVAKASGGPPDEEP